jgi:hypothetical protein
MTTQPMHSTAGIDLSNVEPAETRRAIRQVMQMLGARLEEQQTEIEALLELLVDRHVLSMGELKSALRRVQQRDDKAARFRSALAQAMQTGRPEELSATARDADLERDESVQRPNVYRL